MSLPIDSYWETGQQLSCYVLMRESMILCRKIRCWRRLPSCPYQLMPKTTTKKTHEKTEAMQIQLIYFFIEIKQ